MPGICNESEIFEVFWTVMVCILGKFMCGHFFSTTTFHLSTHSSFISLCLVLNVHLTYCSFERIMAPSLPAVRTFIPYKIHIHLKKYLQNWTEQNTSYEAKNHSAVQEISRLLRNKNFITKFTTATHRTAVSATSIPLQHISLKIYTVWHRIMTIKYIKITLNITQYLFLKSRPDVTNTLATVFTRTMKILGKFILRVNIQFCHQFHFNISHRVKPVYLNFSVKVTENVWWGRLWQYLGNLAI